MKLLKWPNGIISYVPWKLLTTSKDGYIEVYKLVCFDIDEAIDKVLKRKQSWVQRLIQYFEWRFGE